MRRALHRAFSSGAGSQQPIARPRAVSSWGVHSKHGKHVLRYAAAGGAALALGYVAYLNDFDAARMGLRARETWGNLWDSKAGDSDPSVEDLQRALGDPPPPHVLTLIIAVEDVLLLREYGRNGYALHPRQGMQELMTRLVTLGNAQVTLWSENSSQVGAEVQDKVQQELRRAVAHTPPLGLEHMFIRDSGKRKEKRLEYLNRDPKSVLLIDSSTLSEALNPDNTVCVRSQRAAEAEAGGGGGAGSADVTCSAIRAVVTLILNEAAGGEVNVPRALKSLRKDAAAAGFPRDAAGLFGYLQLRALQEDEAEAAKRNSGLGGLLRSSVAGSQAAGGLLSTLRSSTTLEQASSRPFRDPGAELGEDSALTRSLRSANRKLFGQ